MKNFFGSLFIALAVVGLSGSFAAAKDPGGFMFNNLSLSPYVNLEAAYDSNVNYTQQGGAGVQKALSDTILTINPGLDLNYTGNEWGMVGNVWWGYDRYTDVDQLNAARYGESLQFQREAAKGWRLTLAESYIKSSQNDSILDGGQGLRRDQEQFDLTGDLAYQLSEKTAITLSGKYSDLSYINDVAQYTPLYGWQQYTIGLEVARKLTEKSNLLVAGTLDEYAADAPTGGSESSTMYALMAGFGSRATERITYRGLLGINLYEYASGEQVISPSYNLSGSWIINKKLAANVAGSTYFQPSKTGQSGQAEQVLMLSSGLTYRPIAKGTVRFDAAVRREEEQLADTKLQGSTDNLFSVRARAEYRLSRFVMVYSGLEYEKQMSDDITAEYDRYRATLGVNLRY